MSVNEDFAAAVASLDLEDKQQSNETEAFDEFGPIDGPGEIMIDGKVYPIHELLGPAWTDLVVSVSLKHSSASY